MKYAAIAAIALAALGGCSKSEDAIENVQAEAANQAAALENEAADIINEADAAVANVADTLENQAAALEGRIEGDEAEANETAGTGDGNGQ